MTSEVKYVHISEAELTPLVAIVMGSDSDLPTLKPAVSLLEKFAIAHEVRILSAHRTPLEMVDFAQHAEQRGLKVIIAGAGGAAHLPGMVASLTSLPVIGVPVKSKSLSGLDSMYSIVQMPGGIPVATVAIDGALNASLLASQILALSNTVLADKLHIYRQELRKEVVTKDSRLVQVGAINYLEKM